MTKNEDDLDEFKVLKDEIVRAVPCSSSSPLSSRAPSRGEKGQEGAKRPEEGGEYAISGICVRCVLRLSNLDFLYVFDRPIENVDKLQESLARTLGHYPTLAGRVVDDVCIHLNNQGVSFRVQQAAQRMKSIRDIPVEPATGLPYCHIPIPAEQVEGKAPLMTVTVTKFADGWTLGVVMNHMVADGWTFAMFMKDWSDIFRAQGESMTDSRVVDPVICHLPEAVVDMCQSPGEAEKMAELLGARRTSWIKRMFLRLLFRWVLPSMMRKKDPRQGRTPQRLVIHYSEDQVQRIKEQAEARAGTWVSTNEALLTHVWRLLLDAAELDSSQRSLIGASLAVNLRTKLPGVSHRVAGNVITFTTLAMDMNDSAIVKGDSLEKRIHDSVRACLTVEKLTAAHRLLNYVWIEEGDFDAFFETKDLGDFVFDGTPGCIQWNWQVTNPFYKIDFGGSSPTRGIPWDWNQPVTALPGARGGVDIYIDKTNRGPVQWKRATKKWSTISKVFGLVSVSGSWALSTLGFGRRISFLWLASFGLLYKSASSLANRDADTSNQEFYQYVQINAHRTVD